MQLQNPRLPPKTYIPRKSNLRKPVDIKKNPSLSATTNIPILNQMRSFQPNMAPLELDRFSNASRSNETTLEKMSSQIESNKEHDKRTFFFESIVNPQSVSERLKIPEVSIINKNISFSLHREYEPIQISGPTFSCQEIQSGTFENDQDEDNPN